MTSIPIYNTHVFLYKNKLFFAGNFGVCRIDLTIFLPHVTVILNKNSIELKSIQNNLKIKTLNNQLFDSINTSINALNNITKKKLVLFGIGFRSWTYRNSDHLNYMILKVGFSRDVSIEIPKSILAIPLKPTLVLLKSIDKSKLFQFVSFLRSIRKPDAYKGKGIQYLNEKMSLKVGKNN